MQKKPWSKTVIQKSNSIIEIKTDVVPNDEIEETKWEISEGVNSTTTLELKNDNELKS